MSDSAGNKPSGSLGLSARRPGRRRRSPRRVRSRKRQLGTGGRRRRSRRTTALRCRRGALRSCKPGTSSRRTTTHEQAFVVHGAKGGRWLRRPRATRLRTLHGANRTPGTAPIPKPRGGHEDPPPTNSSKPSHSQKLQGPSHVGECPRCQERRCPHLHGRFLPAIKHTPSARACAPKETRSPRRRLPSR